VDLPISATRHQAQAAWLGIPSFRQEDVLRLDRVQRRSNERTITAERVESPSRISRACCRPTSRHADRRSRCLSARRPNALRLVLFVWLAACGSLSQTRERGGRWFCRSSLEPRRSPRARPPQGVQNRRNAGVHGAALDRGASGNGEFDRAIAVANSIVSTVKAGRPKLSSAKARCAPRWPLARPASANLG